MCQAKRERVGEGEIRWVLISAFEMASEIFLNLYYMYGMNKKQTRIWDLGSIIIVHTLYQQSYVSQLTSSYLYTHFTSRVVSQMGSSYLYTHFINRVKYSNYTLSTELSRSDGEFLPVHTLYQQS